MLEKNTDRLFWTLTSIIVGALLLTISVKAFPRVAETAISPITGIVKQEDTVGHKSNDTANKAFSDANNFGNSSNSNTTTQPTDPDAQAKANAVEASSLGFTITDNSNGTGTITGYDTSNGLNVSIPEYVKNNGKLSKITGIGNQAFANDKLISLTIPNSVTSIGDGAFGIPINYDGSATGQLNSLTIPNSVTSIGSYAFLGNNLKSLQIPNSVTSIGDNAFQNNQLTSVNIPNVQAYQSAQTNNAFDSSVNITNTPSSN